ncbi:dATP/dGTP pyrophosphohydrolase domain-containing protein [Klebsiella pneumoniae]
MDSEPVAYIFKHPAGRLFWSLTDESNKGHDDVMPVYASPQPAPERDQVRIAHAEWSQATFGNVGPVGPLKHLSKEALEAAAEPGDLSEWADMQFLLWDAQRRAGITDEQITQAMIDKLAVNKQRSWPEPKDGEPRLHIKEQPAPVAPVVPDFKKLARELVDNLVDCGGLDEGVKEKYLEWAEKTCRAAMLAAAPQPPGSEPATVPGKWIPVSEQMPEKNQNVLISVNFDSDLVEPLICSARYTGSTFRRGDVTVKPGTGIEEATHWMPLPAAPQEVKGE